MEEVWKDVDGFDRKYEFSSTGKFRRKARVITVNPDYPMISYQSFVAPKILNQMYSKTHDDYYVRIVYKEKIFKLYIKDMLSKYFPEVLQDVGAIDRNNSDDSSLYALENKTASDGQGIRCVNTNTYYSSILECANAMKFSYTSFRQRLRSGRNYYKGYTFELV